MVVLAEAVGFGAGVTPMSPTIAVAAIVVFGAGQSEVADLVIGTAARSGF